MRKGCKSLGEPTRESTQELRPGKGEKERQERGWVQPLGALKIPLLDLSQESVLLGSADWLVLHKATRWVLWMPVAASPEFQCETRSLSRGDPVQIIRGQILAEP